MCLLLRRSPVRGVGSLSESLIQSLCMARHLLVVFVQAEIWGPDVFIPSARPEASSGPQVGLHEGRKSASANQTYTGFFRAEGSDGAFE